MEAGKKFWITLPNDYYRDTFGLISGSRLEIIAETDGRRHMYITPSREIMI